MERLGWLPKYLLSILLVFQSRFELSEENSRQKRDILADQPRMVTENGHLIFQTGVNHNITFQSGGGGFVNIDGQNIQSLAALVKTNKETISRLNNQISTLNTQVSSIQQPLLAQINSLTTRVSTLENTPTSAPAPSLAPSTVNNLRRTVSNLRRRISALEGKVTTLIQTHDKNECLSNPCQNGGTCEDKYNGYRCKCPRAWEGVLCDTDVNECSQYAGTELGCQNGATCRNIPGGFSCHCAPNFSGVLCHAHVDDCSSGSSSEICGHGTCINLPNVHAGQPKYKCLCESGWKSVGSNPACVVDIDECTEVRGSRCSTNPSVRCLNVPGTFHCGHCPSGYTGNGFTCSDIDECRERNGGCSSSPRVECINTVGSYTCGPCPAGYQGNGRSGGCSYVGICNINNGGCHPLATCTENTVTKQRTCACPNGYIGSGIGIGSCVQTGGGTGTTSPCSPNPCQHGRCEVVGNTYSCTCDPGYTGGHCTTDIDECLSRPCQNGGTCVDRHNGYVCNCPNNISGRHCQTITEPCGARLRGESGSFSYPRANGANYGHLLSCAWVITTTRGKIVQVRFTRFNLEAHSECNYDFLQVHDGPSASSHMLGKYCGPQNSTTAPRTFNSTNNNVYFWFRTDRSVASDGFAVSWNSSSPICGGELTGQHGNINSPGYPGNYPHNRTCTWTVAVNPGNTILFTFARLRLESHINCSYDWLEFRDGQSDTDPLIRKFCNSTTPAPIQTTGPYAWLQFHSDHSLSDRGFHITYAARSAGSACGGVLTQESGVLISPNYPNPYNHHAQCVWVIRTRSSEVLLITFTNMQLERSLSCRYDYVEVRNGGDELSPLVGHYCGTTLPAAFISSGNQVWIKFKTDESNRAPGFRLTWSVDCGGNFTETTGVLRSPLYPSNYPNEKECIYRINQAPGYTILLEFTNFNVEAGRDGNTQNCQYDSLEVRDGPGPASTLIGIYCGTAVPPPAQSTSNSLWLKFKTDGSRGNTGFMANYVATGSGVDEETCGGSLTSTTGVFTSPGYPSEYPHGVNCTWYITVPAGNVIRLSFHSFSLESQASCNYDHVEVFDSSSSTDTGGLLGRFCGSSKPPVLTSEENVMTVVFRSDRSANHGGFTAFYVALSANNTCGGEIRGNTGIISSPNYPNNYPHQRQCVWTITMDTGRQVELNFTDFAMESHRACQYDFVEVRNGGFASSPLIGRYCGAGTDNIIRSSSNRVYIKFRSDQSDSAKGFQLFYDGTATGCGSDLTSPSGSIVSPNYPLAYGHRTECYWTITVARGSHISMSFVDLDIESHSKCNFDFLQVREKSGTGNLLGQFCGAHPPAPFRSAGNKVWLKFRSDFSTSGRGFHISYHAVCSNVILTSRYGVIESPNFPNAYPGRRDCTWVIRTTLGNTVNVSFSHFHLESHTDCKYDYLQVRDGQSETSTSLGKFCSNNLPATLASSGENLFVHFVSDHSNGGNGFRLEWITNGCGEDLRGSSGTLQSPNYPNPYEHRRECIWTITVPTGQAIKFTIDHFDLESHSNCAYDVLEVYGGPDAASPQLARLCHPQSSTSVITNTGNTMYIRFKSDNSRGGTGFHASYQAIPGGCGGNFSIPTGTIMSKNYPQNYPVNTSCDWLITVAPNRPVILTFVEFNVENHSNCSYDYVAVYDGNSSSAPKLVHACGSTLPSPAVYTSSNNQMLIRLRSDVSLTSKGFKANFTTGCGGTVIASRTGVITSPNYPQLYQPNHNCTWRILGENNNDRIFLTFTHMDLETSNNCRGDYVNVYDGDGVNSPQIGTYCGNAMPGVIASQSSILTVFFASDRSIARTGFRATYTQSISACGADFTTGQGTFASPAYPDSYPSNVECVWTITASPGSFVQISFSVFDMEQQEYCNFDYIELRNAANGNQLIGRYCGNTVPSNITTTSNRLWIKFRSNGQNPGRGFVANYAIAYGGDVTGNSGRVTSPLYPSNYPHFTSTVWTITVATNMKIRITFSVMDLETGTNCVYDYVQFRDGGTASGVVMGKFCGVAVPEPFTSSGNQLRVEFRSDFSSGGQGFVFDWVATDQALVTPTLPGPTPTPVEGCGGSLSALNATQSFVSPGYPTGYGNNLNCIWTIRSEPGTRVSLNITDINLESHGFCFYDNIQFYSAEVPRGRVLGRYCGRVANSDAIVSSSNVMSVRFKTDHGTNGTGFAIQYTTVCGGYFERPVGVLKSPNYPFMDYSTNQNCTWSIKVSNGRMIRVHFDAFNLQASTPCNDYVKLLNGINSQSPPLITDTNNDGVYCGQTIPKYSNGTELQTSSQRLYVNFVSDGSVSAPGFSMTWNEVSVTCGGRYTITDSVSSGIAMSPNYPSTYPHNVECVWVITGPATERLQLDFMDEFDIERHSNCLYDYIQVRDGGTANSRSLGKFCGNAKPGTLKATGNLMYIRFRTDNSVNNKKGFKAKYKIATCGGTISGQSGSIISPNYPQIYDTQSDCIWIVNGPAGHYLTLTFDAFTLAPASDCSTASTYLEIREVNSTGSVLGRYCGRTKPSALRTSDSYVYIHFVSGSARPQRGFKLNFQASVEGCGGRYVTPTGVITSPNFPGSYAHSRVCKYYISVPKGRRVTLNFEDFNIESHRSCLYDYVQVRNGLLSYSPILARRMCGSQPPPAVESSGNTMTVIFNTDGSVNGGGFRATWTSDNEAKCGGEIIRSPSTMSGLIQSPGFGVGGNYSNNEQCIWILANSMPINTSISLRFQQFQLEYDSQCRYDMVEIREGNNVDGRLIGRFCGNNTIKSMVTHFPSVWIIFKSDHSIVKEGFSLQYNFSSCGGLLTQDSGLIVSPNYPRNYDHSDSCGWEIFAPENTRIEIKVIDLRIENSTGCLNDYLEMFNGGSAGSPSLGKLCASRYPTPNPFVSQSNKMRIEFHTDDSGSDVGFKLQYRFTHAGYCGGLLHSNKGQVTTPGHPGRYSPNTECVWDIVVQTGYHILLTFNRLFDLEGSSGCSKDNVMVYDYNENGTYTSLGRWCHNVGPPELKSSSNKIRLKFRSDSSTNGNGFSANWTVGCGAQYTKRTGIILSPGHPGRYANNLTCDYVITGSPANYIVVEFDRSFRIETGLLCRYDYIQAYEGNSTGRSIGKYCGVTAPQPLSALGKMTLRFITDKSVVDTGFVARYYTTDCGGRRTQAAGVIHSPSHPVNYLHNMNCTWTIQVAPNRIVDLKFNDFQIEAHSRCSFDYVLIRDGGTNGRILGKLCGSELPDNVRSTGPMMTVTFVSDESSAFRGFNATYRTTFGENQGCGGVLNQTSGSISSIDANNDGQYDSDLDCVWQIIVQDNNVVRLTVTDFDIELANGCIYDYLQIRDGFLEGDPLVGKFCGSRAPNQFTTSSSRAWIKFFSDSDTSGRGFNLSWTQIPAICGGSFAATTTPQVITSPNYPGNYPANSNCRWVLDAPEFEQIQVNVTDIEIESHRHCQFDYLEFRDTPLGDYGQSAIYCGNTQPAEFDSAGRTMQINFKSDGTTHSKGFSLQYMIRSCNRTYTDNNGRILSPRFPSNYPSSSNCYISIVGPANSFVSLYFNSLFIEPHNLCNYDYLEITNGTNGPSISKLCGLISIPLPIFTTANSVGLHFVTDRSLTHPGFDITYIASYNIPGCGGNVTSPRGSFTSPGYPGNYSQDAICSWLIEVPVRKQITLKFAHFDLELESTCDKDYVAVYNGGDASDPLIGKYCGNNQPANMKSTANKLFLKFSSDRSQTGTGFRVTFTS